MMHFIPVLLSLSTLTWTLRLFGWVAKNLAGVVTYKKALDIIGDYLIIARAYKE